METSTNFDPSKYNYKGVVIVDGNGTGHAMTCPFIAEGATTDPDLLSNVVPFQNGGFDLFCEHNCMDDILPTFTFPKVEGPSMDDPSFGNGPATPTEKVEEDDAELTMEELETWLVELGRKVEPYEVTTRKNELATEWAKTYKGDFSFMLDMRDAALTRRGGLSKGQAKGTLNCLRAELNRRPKKVQKGDGSKELDLSELPAGMYAVPNGETRLKVSIRKPGANSKWHGWTFVSDGAEYGSQRNYGKQAPDSIYVGEIQDALEAILADPLEASKAYGKLVGKCGACGRHLEDEQSVAEGIGPICKQKF